MFTTQLGGTGLRVSRLCLGTMTFGLQTNEEVSRSILDVAAHELTVEYRRGYAGR